jgi:hypothetical protein
MQQARNIKLTAWPNKRSPSPSSIEEVPWFLSAVREDVEMQEPNESATTSMDMDLCQPTTTACYVPKLKMDGNKWLDKLFVNTRKATKDEVIAAFEHPKLECWES